MSNGKTWRKNVTHAGSQLTFKMFRWDLSRKHYQIPLKARIHPPTTPKTPQDNKKPPPGTPDTPPVPQEQRWLLPSTHETFWEAFKLSRDVRENSGRRKSVRRCLLSVWNVCDCLTLLWENSMASQECYMRVWGYLGLSWGCWTV